MSDLNSLIEYILFSTIYDIKIDFLTQRVNIKAATIDFDKNVRCYELKIEGVTEIKFKSEVASMNYIELSDYNIERIEGGYSIYLELSDDPFEIKCKDFNLELVRKRKLNAEELKEKGII